VAIFFGFVALAIWNTFMVLAVVIVLRRSGEYAFVRPGREMLWTPMSKETKYKAKNFRRRSGLSRGGRRGGATSTCDRRCRLRRANGSFTWSVGRCPLGGKRLVAWAAL
jgi:ATP/ADP translocase